MSGPQHITHTQILRVVLTYAAFAALWILLSDRALDWLLHDTLQLNVAHTLKGWLFVAVTSMLLYGMLRRMAGEWADVELPVLPRKNWSLPFVLASAVIVGVTGLNVAHELKDQRNMEVARLQALVELKTQQITAWLGERQADGEFVRTSTFLAEYFRQWRDAGQAASGTLLQSRLEQLRRFFGYQRLLLLDRDGSMLWGGDEAGRPLAPALRAATDAAVHEHRIGRIGPYIDPNGRPRLDWVVPINEVGDPAPLIVLRSDPVGALYAVLQAWPGPNVSGELLLLRRDGDDLEYLSPLRQPTEGSLSVRTPLASQTLLTPQVLRGDAPQSEVVSGRDYRNVPVVGVVQPVAGTDWFLLAKLDQSELYVDAVGDSVWIALSGLLVVFLIGAGIAMWLQRERLVLAEIIRQSQVERLRALQLLGAVADSSEDAIFAKDLEGRYILFNPAASRVVGKPVEAVLGQDDRAIFPEAQAQMLMAFDRRVIAEDRVETMEELLDTAAGTRVFLATKGPLRDADGKVIGIFGISRDITPLKQAEQALRDSEERSRLAQSSANVGIWDWDLGSGRLNWTAELEVLYGYEPGSFEGTYEAFRQRVHPDDVAEVERLRDEALAAHTCFDFDFRILLPSGLTRWVNCKGAATYAETGEPKRLLGVNVDITQRKRAEDALRQQVELNRRYLDTVQTIVVALDGAGRIVMINRCGCELLGYAAEELLGLNWFEVCLPQPEGMARVYPVFQRVMVGELEAARYFENAILSRDGRKHLIAWQNAYLTDADERIVGTLSSGEDITQRREAELALQQQTMELKNRNAELERFNRATVGRELDMIELKQRVNALSAELGREAPYPLDFLDASTPRTGADKKP